MAADDFGNKPISQARPQSAMLLADILPIVLECLTNNKKFLTLAGVNRTWALLANSLIWRTLPKEALFRLNDRPLQPYANLIHHLEVMFWGRSALAGIGFPRLTSLRVPFLCGLSRYIVYLQICLAEFSCSHHPPPELGAALADHCPRLQTVKLGATVPIMHKHS